MPDPQIHPRLLPDEGENLPRVPPDAAAMRQVFRAWKPVIDPRNPAVAGKIDDDHIPDPRIDIATDGGDIADQSLRRCRADTKHTDGQNRQTLASFFHGRQVVGSLWLIC